MSGTNYIQLIKGFILTFIIAGWIILPGIFVSAEAQVNNSLNSDTIIVRGDQYYPPFEFINEKGEPDGFNVELFEALAKKLNLKYRLELIPWDKALYEMGKKEIDVLIGLMISESRQKTFHFTVPHSVMTHGIFTGKDSKIKTFEDLRDKEVIVQKSDRMHDYLIETGLTDKIILATSPRQALAFLNQGNHDAALIGNFQGLHIIRHYKLQNIELRNSGIEPQLYALAVNRDNHELLALLNNGLYHLKETGEYDKIYQKWFSVYEETYFLQDHKNWVIGAGLFVIILVGFIALLRFQVYQTTRHLQESEARYKSIFQSKHTIMMLIDPSTGDIIDVNPAAVEFYGWPEKQFVSMNINQVNTLSNEEIQNELKRAKAANENIFHFEHRLSNGEIRKVEVHSGLIVLKKKELLFSVIHDITEKVKAQEETRNWQNLLQFIIMHAPSAIAVYDNSLRYIYVSDHFLKNFDLRQSDILGKTPFEVMPSLPSRWRSIYRRALQGEIIKSEEDIMKRQDGTSETIRWECRPWNQPDGTIGGVILYSEIITERKRSEELRYNLEVARKTTQIKQTFLASISHEMRTPLNGIIGLSNYLAKTKLSAEQSKHLDIIIDSSNTLLQLINQVLNLSKIESQQMPVALEQITTIDLLEKLNNSFSFAFKEKGIKYVIDISDNFPASFVYKESLLMQVLTNLIGNALKFTDKGKVSVHFGTTLNAQNEHEIIISVEDTGPGIHKEHHDNIFLEFIQVHDSNKSHLSGTGLGLPISKKIVESFGGKIGVKSIPGKGSTFWFTIIPQILRTELKKEDPANQEITSLNLFVLLVEDKKVNRIVAELLLKEMGCKVHNAENGLIAIDKVQQNKYDVILMDIQMPVMDGITAMKKLHSMEIEVPPIIGLSAEAMEGDAERYIAMGMDDYLTKPIDSKLLFSKLCAVMEKYKITL